MLPRIVKNFNVFIDGRGQAGRAEEVTLPKLTVKTEEFRAGGMDAPVELDMGMEKLECSISLADYDPQTIGLLGLLSANTPFTLRGAIQRQGEPVIPVVIRMQGAVKELDRGSWKAGEKATMAVAVTLNRYSEEIGGVKVVDIDVVNMVRTINGVDQLAQMRQAIGA